MNGLSRRRTGSATRQRRKGDCALSGQTPFADAFRRPGTGGACPETGDYRQAHLPGLLVVQVDPVLFRTQRGVRWRILAALTCHPSLKAQGAEFGTEPPEPEGCTGSPMRQTQKRQSPSQWTGFEVILVAWGGIEPPTRGFSRQRALRLEPQTTPRSVTLFWPAALCPSRLTEPSAEPYRPPGFDGHTVFLCGSTG